MDWIETLRPWDLLALEPALRRFRDDLIRFNRGRNLVSRKAAPEDVSDMILESVAAARALPLRHGGAVLDLGSGAGLPGIPVAIVRPELPVTLLERRRTRCDFLRRECRALQLSNAQVLESDAEHLSAHLPHVRAFDCVLLKAVTQPARALALARPFLRSGGCAVLFGRVADRSMDGPDAWAGEAAPGWAPPERIPLAAWAGSRGPAELLLVRPLVPSDPAPGRAD